VRGVKLRRYNQNIDYHQAIIGSFLFRTNVPRAVGVLSARCTRRFVAGMSKQMAIDLIAAARTARMICELCKFT